MATITTYTHSYTLNPGESFTLPPGSNILFTTDNAGLETVCAELPEEDLACFGVVTFAQLPDDDGRTDVIEADDVKIIGLEKNGTSYNFANEKLITDISGIFQEIDTLGFGPLFVDRCTNTYIESNRETLKVIHLFKTIPSFANNLKFVAKGPIPDPNSIANGYYIFPVIPLSEIESQNHSPLCLDCTES